MPFPVQHKYPKLQLVWLFAWAIGMGILTGISPAMARKREGGLMQTGDPSYLAYRDSDVQADDVAHKDTINYSWKRE